MGKTLPKVWRHEVDQERDTHAEEERERKSERESSRKANRSDCKTQFRGKHNYADIGLNRTVLFRCAEGKGAEDD